jgi:type I restriction enzyme S subunit
MKGMAYPAINDEKFYNGYIPLPPLAEQKRIVAKVDELMGLCDELEARQQERELRKSVLVRSSLSRFAESPTRENLGYLFHNSYDIPPSELRKSILTLAVQGKLVPQDPENEPADVLIERIITEKSALVNGKLMRSSNSHTTRDIDQIDGELPHGWAWTRIEEITSIGTGSTPLKSEKDYYANGDIPWVTSAATNNYFINEPDQFVTRKALKDYNLRIYPKGSLVIALYGQGKTRGQVGQLMFDATTNQACAVLEFFESGKSVRDYIRLFFLKKYDELRERAAGAAQPNLSGGMIRLTRVPLPPLAEQHRIVAKVDQLMALVDELERQQAASREKASNLLDAIVHEMTSGV